MKNCLINVDYGCNLKIVFTACLVKHKNKLNMKSYDI